MFCSKKKLLPSCPNIITPDQIPSFFIPPKLSSLPDRGGHVGRWFQKKPSDVGSKFSPRTLVRSANCHVIQVEDVEQEIGSPKQKHGSSIADTIMGGPYLSESPHTRRRESLFHQMCPTHGPREPQMLSRSDPDCVLNWKAFSHDFRLLTLDSDTTSSTESSPYGSPLLNCSLDRRLRGQTSGNQPTFSPSLTVKTLTRASSLSTEETSSTDTSPNLPTKMDHEENPRSSMVHLVPPPIFHLDFICCQDHLTKETEVTLSKGGLIRLSAEYVKELGRLRVKLVNAENLYPVPQDPKAISCCVVMCLMPGKLQKQRSTVIRRSRNPIFNEDFYFEGVKKEELGQLRLRVKVVNRGNGVKRDTLLGNNEIQLSAILPL
ncbi:C2 calcium-dependent domain-containing protein 4D [Pyxicephalus adspersus]|uniref:C2 domain-containing protein n=1 Tax=Pyxicephalus adspersus TaxID=30357 RepID=A0AAV2ZK29_PYXAD|nr:TPA: hypothetical protein GDO54_004893 [Pyxicephalus adspersus]